MFPIGKIGVNSFLELVQGGGEDTGGGSFSANVGAQPFCGWTDGKIFPGGDLKLS